MVYKEFYLGTMGYQQDERERELLELSTPLSITLACRRFPFLLVALSILAGVYIHGLFRNSDSPFMREPKQSYSRLLE